MKVDDFPKKIEEFKKELGVNERGRSFDYCYNYFYHNRGEDLKKDLEKSCLVLGFYLASWGMLRGNTNLIKKSAKIYEPLIEYISKCEKEIWLIDIQDYDKRETIEKIRNLYNDIKNIIGIKEKFEHAIEQPTIKKTENDYFTHIILVTKIMLGVFGIIPAFDSNFCAGFKKLSGGVSGFTAVNDKSLKLIKEFYIDNETDIYELSKTTFTKDFLTGKKTELNYPKAKIIDMYGFEFGKELLKKRE